MLLLGTVTVPCPAFFYSGTENRNRAERSMFFGEWRHPLFFGRGKHL